MSEVTGDGEALGAERVGAAEVAVGDALESILRFWFDRGVAGFRIDVANMII